TPPGTAGWRGRSCRLLRRPGFDVDGREIACRSARRAREPRVYPLLDPEAPLASSLAMGADTPTHERKSIFFLAGFERRVLPRIAAALPRWVVPDHLTLLGVLAATWIAIAYGLSNRDEAWLWAASGGLLVHWFGDSLDGTLARVRKIERPRYGFYLDHLTDAYSTTAIGIGLGLSPSILLWFGLAMV